MDDGQIEVFCWFTQRLDRLFGSLLVFKGGGERVVSRKD